MRALKNRFAGVGRERIVRFIASLTDDDGALDAVRAKRGLLLLLDDENSAGGAMERSVDSLLRMAGGVAAQQSYVDVVTAVDALMMTNPRALSVSLFDLFGVPAAAQLSCDSSAPPSLVVRRHAVVRYLAIMLRVAMARSASTRDDDGMTAEVASVAASTMSRACFADAEEIGFAPFVVWLSGAMGGTAAAADPSAEGAHLAPHLLAPAFSIAEARAAMGLHDAGSVRLARVRAELDRASDASGGLDRARFTAAVYALATWQRQNTARAGGRRDGALPAGRLLIDEAVAQHLFDTMARAAAAQAEEAVPRTMLPVAELVMSLSSIDTKDSLAACATVFDTLAVGATSGGAEGDCATVGAEELSLYFLCSMRLGAALPVSLFYVCTVHPLCVKSCSQFKIRLAPPTIFGLPVLQAAHHRTVARATAAAWLRSCAAASASAPPRRIGRSDFLFCCSSAMALEIEVRAVVAMTDEKEKEIEEKVR